MCTLRMTWICISLLERDTLPACVLEPAPSSLMKMDSKIMLIFKSSDHLRIECFIKSFFLFSFEPLRSYTNEDVELVLPGTLTFTDNSVHWLSVYDKKGDKPLGYVTIPNHDESQSIVPPSLRKSVVSSSSCS